MGRKLPQLGNSDTKRIRLHTNKPNNSSYDASGDDAILSNPSGNTNGCSYDHASSSHNYSVGHRDCSEDDGSNDHYDGRCGRDDHGGHDGFHGARHDVSLLHDFRRDEIRHDVNHHGFHPHCDDHLRGVRHVER